MSWLRWFKGEDAHSPELARDRFIVFDLETTGLNPHTDEIIAIGASAIKGAAVQLGDQFSAHLQADHDSHPQAALAHRLGKELLQQAPPPEQVLEQFSNYVGNAPCLAYHSAFDDQFLKRGYKGSPRNKAWDKSLDVAHWLLWLHPELGPQPPTLDRALSFARIHPMGGRRHNAQVDAMLTAQLVLSLIPKTQSQGIERWAELKKRILIANKLRQART